LQKADDEKVFIIFTAKNKHSHVLPDFAPFSQIVCRSWPPSEKFEIFWIFNWLPGTHC